ncbi:MAG: hypothetical protein JXR78_06955 [Victivallales bacterium]|nr:hypothetical protein [Victivallales bacterium]
MDEEEAKSFALAVAAYCVRTTVIEKYHSEGKLTDEEMKTFNIEVTNRLFTFFKLFYSESMEEKEALVRVLSKYYPHNWNTPEPDKNFMNSIRYMIDNLRKPD